MMDVPARFINDKTMVPLRFLAESLGYNVEWDAERNTAVISTQ
ncbi:MAG: copper amine oxidase N-terminal domain-containing protein [Clostridiaceae bacterium]|nr:copper amine oxidase N-terminal domain-containing protein [Clostridiaceae bacterium]